MSKTIEHTLTFEIETCCSCGVAFGLEKWMRKRLVESHDSFYCPNGHAQHFTGKTEAQQLREQLATEQQNSLRQSERARRAEQDAKHFESSRNAYKGQITKIKKRVGNGVCPCCNRTFAALARHMATKHPEYKHGETDS
jgi:NMD protein affecting ribosome stability and mRNA decay